MADGWLQRNEILLLRSLSMGKAVKIIFFAKTFLLTNPDLYVSW